jgi:hypothetical protein
MIALANHTQNHAWEISDKIEDKTLRMFYAQKSRLNGVMSI